MKRRNSLLFISILAIFFIYFLNITFDKSELQNLNGGEVTIIGHGGLGFTSWFPFNYLPANSYGSLSKAILNEKAQGVEVDVQMTADRQFVLYHDELLDSKTSAIGCISEWKYADLLALNYKLEAPFDWFQSEKIIGLEQLVLFLKEQEEFPFLHLDIRNKSKCLNEQENAKWERDLIFELLKKLGGLGVPKEKILIISISRSFILGAFNMKCPYPLSFEVVGDTEKGIAWAEEQGIDQITIKPKLLTKEISAQLHAKNIRVITFGAKSKSGNKKLLELNPDVIQTNNIKALKELMGYE